MLAYVGAATTKSVVLGILILATASLFVDLEILHPWWMLSFLLLTAVSFCLFGFVIGVWANGWEQTCARARRQLRAAPLISFRVVPAQGGPSDEELVMHLSNPQ